VWSAGHLQLAPSMLVPLREQDGCGMRRRPAGAAMSLSRIGTATALAWCLLLAQPLPAAGQLRVMTPDWLVREFRESMGRIDGSTATFGAPFYGDRVLGRLVYGESQLNHSHCVAEDYEVPKPAEFLSGTSRSEGVRLINIVMVRRGKCSFTTKVKVAYEKGAHAVLIVDREDSNLTSKDMANIIVADDGFGNKINIPSVLISKVEGRKLIQAVRRTQVVVELAWDLPTNHVVNVDLWMSSASRESLRFLKEFASKRRILNEVVNFQPHYAVFGIDGTDPKIYNDLCSDNSGQYCAEDPDGAGPITGKDVLAEDVRQLCIHTVHKVARVGNTERGGPHAVEYAAQYWDYIEKLGDSCPLDAPRPQDRFGLECSTKLMKQVGVDIQRVEDCVRVNATPYLQREREHPAWSPRALRINGWRYSGIPDADLVTRAICSGFITQPSECKAIIRPRDPMVPYLAEAEVKAVSFMQMMAWLLGVTLAIFAGLLLYKRHLKEEIRRAISQSVQEEVILEMSQYSKIGA